MASVYQVNKGVNQSIQFKGLKAQYIWYLGAGIVALLVLFAAMYISGIAPYICITIIMASGSALVAQVYRMSNKYGEYGLMKAFARKSVPKVIICRSRIIFIKLKGDGKPGKRTAGN